KRFAAYWPVFALLFVPVAAAVGCGSKTSATSASAAAGATGAGGGAGCQPTLGNSPSGCPETKPAEDAYTKAGEVCGFTNGDIDITTDPKNPTPTASGKTKICATCACRQAVF